MLPFGRALALFALCSACSLQSTDALTRCQDAPHAADCALTAGGQGGVASAGTGAEGGTPGSEAGAGGSSPECQSDDDCAPNQACLDGACEPGLRVEYVFNPDENDTIEDSTAIRPDFVIFNDLMGESVPLSELAIRYYYTFE